MKTNRMILWGLAVLVSGVAWASCWATGPKAATQEQPIRIVSDRMEVFNDKRMVIFTGNAVATQGERTIRSDRLILYYKDRPGNSTVTGPAASRDLERVEAKGNVRITEGERIVTGDEGLFEQAAQRITMTGNAVLREGRNVIRGERVVVYIDENRGVVDSGKNERVTATIYPGEKQEEKR